MSFTGPIHRIQRQTSRRKANKISKWMQRRTYRIGKIFKIIYKIQYIYIYNFIIYKPNQLSVGFDLYDLSYLLQSAVTSIQPDTFCPSSNLPWLELTPETFIYLSTYQYINSPISHSLYTLVSCEDILKYLLITHF